jgi:ribosomal protein S18 acetylase RimI-like enzyme
MNASISIRRATPADMTVIGRLGALLVREHHDFDPQRFIPAMPGTEKGYGSYLGSQLNEPNVVILVAERDGKVIGYSYSGVEGTDYMALRGPAGAMYDIVVDPDYRQQGVGRMLVNATLEALKSQGVPRVLLSTAEKNAAAQRLFERTGFRRTMIEMTRELDGTA